MTSIDIREAPMTQVTARLPDELLRQMDETAQRLKRSRAELIRRAIAYYLDNVEDLRLGLERLNDLGDLFITRQANTIGYGISNEPHFACGARIKRGPVPGVVRILG